jgi:hypothetical protein
MSLGMFDKIISVEDINDREKYIDELVDLIKE